MIYSSWLEELLSESHLDNKQKEGERWAGRRSEWCEVGSCDEDVQREFPWFAYDCVLQQGSNSAVDSLSKDLEANLCIESSEASPTQDLGLSIIAHQAPDRCRLPL
jgi:hypothetical protein